MVGAIRFGVPLVWALLRRRRPDPTVIGVALRRYFESLGFTYIKLGQFLALRFDILPHEVCAELRKLFDRASSIEFDEVQRIIEHELGGPLDEFFQWVDPAPTAAASLAQVHRATALDGQLLALKVQRPEARRDFTADMLLAHALARKVDSAGIIRAVSLGELLAEFERFTSRELDFEAEGRVATRLAGSSTERVRFPAMRPELSTDRLLAMEFVEGRPLTEAIELLKEGRHDEYDERFPGIDIADVVRTIARESLRQILVTGLFHADPHPGNILLESDGTVVYLDFGMFGSLTPSQRLNCLGYIQNAALGNPDRSFEHFYRLVIPTPDLDRTAFKGDMVKLMRDWAEWGDDQSTDVSTRHIGAIMQNTFATMHENGARLDTELLLFWRVLFVLDSVALDLAEQVDLIRIMRDFFSDRAMVVRPRLERLSDPRMWSDASTGVLVTTAACVRETAAAGGAVFTASTRRSRPERSARWADAAIVGAGLLLLVAAILTRV